MSNWLTKKLREFSHKINWNLSLRVIEILVLVGGLYLAIVQISDLRKVNSGQIALDITRDIYSTERYQNNPALIKLIEENKPILVANKGPFQEQDLDNLLGEWDLIARFNRLEILPDDLVYQQFSFDIVKAYTNIEIKSYIRNIRKKYNDDLMFADFEWLAQWAEATSKNK